jgi:L-amino acid N-acyltransferase YncA
MTIYTTAESKSDLKGILSLQKENLAQGLTRDEIKSQGFVTVCHSYDQLKKMNDHENHVIAKDNDKVVAYVLAMTQHSRFDIPILLPMFEAFGAISYKGKKITDYNYLIVGQVCIDKAYRGQGLFDNCYAAYKKHFRQKYDFAITEIASTNLRSLNAHKRVGFQEVHSYMAPDSDKTQWIVVVWDWKNN